MFEIVTDSTCDIEEKYLDEIKYVPLYIIKNEKKIKSRIDEEFKYYFYEKLYKEKENLKTSQPSIKDFLEVYKKSEYKNILVLTISSELSGTYNVAKAAKKFTNKNVIVIDSKQASIGLGLLVKKAIELREKGYFIDEVKRILEKLKINTYIYVEDINYLMRSGRMNLAKRLFLKLLNKKPILYLDNGKLKLYKFAKNYFSILEIKKDKTSLYYGSTIEFFNNLPKPKVLASPIIAINTGPAVGISYID